MENYVLQQIQTQENASLRLYVMVLDNSVEVILLQDGNAWKSTVIKKKLEHLAKEHKVTLNDYCLKLLEHLKSSNSDVIYSFNNKEFTINRLLNDSLKVKYFVCKLEKVNYAEYVGQIMDKLYSDNMKLAEQLNNCSKENADITKYKMQCELKLKDLVTKKLEDENEQMGRFILILNEKKRCIQHLTELLEAFRKGRSPVNPVVKVSSRKTKKEIKKRTPVQKQEMVSESESDTETRSNSEDEDTDSSQVEKSKECQPSTSTQMPDFLDDDFGYTPMLPKRVKTVSKTSDIMIAPKPSLSKLQEENVEIAGCSKSPNIDLSTQQLLDML